MRFGFFGGGLFGDGCWVWWFVFVVVFLSVHLKFGVLH